MWKARLAGAVALATIGSTFAFAGSETTPAHQISTVQSESVLSHAQIARLKSMLKLTPAQEQFWPAVEKAFQELGRQQFEDGAAAQGLVQGIRSRAAVIGLDVMALRRLVAAAYPLIQTLNDEQKQSALAFARSVGLESVAAAF